MSSLSSSNREGWKKRSEKWREITVTKERNTSGKFIRIVVKGTGRSGMICIPEIDTDLGWIRTSAKIQRFMAGEKNHSGSQAYLGGKRSSDKSYKEAAEIPPWANANLAVSRTLRGSKVDFVVDEYSCEGNLKFLERCLVGRVGNSDCSIPPRIEVQNWVNQRWKTAGGVRLADLNEKYFLFVFPSKEEAGRILQRKNWVFNQLPLFLDRWGAAACCHREDRKPKMVRVRALDLPLHLWGSSVFREIGHKCGGFVEVDEATEQRTDLRWARILVRFNERTPACIRIGVGGKIFSVPIWVETTAFCLPWSNHNGKEDPGRWKKTKAKRRGEGVSG